MPGGGGAGGGVGAAASIRPASPADLERGLLEALESLSPGAAGGDRKAVQAAMAEIASNPNHVIMVAAAADDDEGGGGRIVGAATLLVEPKLIHGGGRAGHIEDVAVASGSQGRGVGAALIKACLDEAGRRGCYKTILDCSDGVRPFYEKIGFVRHSNEMRYDHARKGQG